MTRPISVAFAMAFGLFTGACGHSAALPAAPTAAAVPVPAPVPTPVPKPLTSIAGFAFDAAYRPLAGVAVVLADGVQAGASAITDASGSFSLTGTFWSADTLRASKDGYMTVAQPVGNDCCSGGQGHVGFTLEALNNMSVETGGYTLTWMTDGACTGVPDDLQTRTYKATVTRTSSSHYSVVPAGVLVGDGGFDLDIVGNDIAFTWGTDGLYEAIPPGTSLGLFASGSTTAVTSPISALAFSVEGTLNYCVLKSGMSTSASQCGPPEQVLTHVTCQSSSDRVILTRQ